MIKPPKINGHIHQSNLIEGYDDPLFDEQSMIAWNWLNTQPPLALSIEIICNLQKRIVQSQHDLQPEWRGKLREIEVRVGSRKCPPAAGVERMLKWWLNSYTFTHPHTSHVEFEKIHPFVDGNGRTGRMLMWWLQINRGEKPTLLLNDEKQKYYRWFEDV